MAFSNRLVTILLGCLGLPELVDELDEAIHGVSEDLTLDMTINVTNASTKVFRFRKIGNLVTLHIPDMQWTDGDNTTLDCTSIPAEYQPLVPMTFLNAGTVNGSGVVMYGYISDDAVGYGNGVDYDNFPNAQAGTVDGITITYIAAE